MAIYKVRRATAASVLVVAGLLTACSANVEVGKAAAVPKDKLATVVKEKLEKKANAKADSVTCDGDLKAEKGATQHCVLTVEGSKLGVTVTATGVDGSDVQFDAVVDAAPLP